MREESNYTWVMVANGSECKVFSIQLSHLKLVKEFYYPEGHLHSIDLGTERPARVHESGSATRHAIEPQISLQRKAKIKFSHLIADYLNTSVDTIKPKRLILIASPEFLGEVRKHLSKHTTSLITKEINKNLVDAKEEEILKHIL